MTTSRRDFLKTTSVTSGGLLMGLVLPASTAVQAAGTVYTPNAWVHIADNNAITLLTARSEMGQGVFTSMPMLIAEELNVDMSQISVQNAPANAAAYTNDLLGAQSNDGWTT